MQRNKGKKGYRPKQAQIKADKRKAQAAKALKTTATVIVLIEAKIVLDWSPEQISRSLKDELGILISHERICQHIWADKRHGGTLCTHLRQSNKKRKKQYGSKDKRSQIRNRVSIDERPAIVAEKHTLAIGRLILR
jgi:IS30 family transposase